jgi:hypothetical protein
MGAVYFSVFAFETYSFSIFTSIKMALSGVALHEFALATAGHPDSFSSSAMCFNLWHWL